MSNGIGLRVGKGGGGEEYTIGGQALSGTLQCGGGGGSAWGEGCHDQRWTQIWRGIGRCWKRRWHGLLLDKTQWMGGGGQKEHVEVSPVEDAMDKRWNDWSTAMASATKKPLLSAK